jgi:hypothetical protein
MNIGLVNFQRRILQDALSEATADYWRRRARALEKALSRPTDYRGRATPEQIAERDEQLRAAILACSLRAQLYEPGADICAEVDAALAEVA